MMYLQPKQYIFFMEWLTDHEREIQEATGMYPYDYIVDPVPTREGLPVGEFPLDLQQYFNAHCPLFNR